MLNKQLNVGDYIFTAGGGLARIIRVNKQTYSADSIISHYSWPFTIPFNGINKTQGIEWFECTEPQAKALELAFKKYTVKEKLNDTLYDIKDLIGQAKYFLKKVEDIEVIEPDDLDDQILLKGVDTKTNKLL